MIVGMLQLPYVVRIVIVIFVVLALAELAARAVNWVLVVILLGLVLAEYGPFTNLIAQLGHALSRR
jgi:hypothetical protein